MDADEDQDKDKDPTIKEQLFRIGRLNKMIFVLPPHPTPELNIQKHRAYKGDPCPFVEEAEALRQQLLTLRQKDGDRRRENEQQRRQRMQRERAEAFLRTPIGRLVAQASRIRRDQTEQDKSQDAPSDQSQNVLSLKDASKPDQREQ